MVPDNFVVDPEAKYPMGSWEEYFQKLEANKRLEENGKDGGVSLGGSVGGNASPSCQFATQGTQH